MKTFFNNKKKVTITIGIMFFIIFCQGIVMAKLLSEREVKDYQVNLVKINTEKDSVDYAKIKSDLNLIDGSIREMNQFLLAKNITDERIMKLEQDSMSSAIYLAKISNRYSQYLVDLQNKLQLVPLGNPTEGYVSSNFGKRVNPIPNKNLQVKVPSKPAINTEQSTIVEKDSLGNVVKKVVATPTLANNSKAVKDQNNPPAEADQIQFHKGIDIAVPYGTDVRNAAAGTVIFAGQKGGYGNCIIISHHNGLATLYAHLSQILVESNDQVKVNQIIAKSGNSGRSTGPHLHYEVHKNNTPVNPKLFLNY